MTEEERKELNKLIKNIDKASKSKKPIEPAQRALIDFISAKRKNGLGQLAND